MLPVVRPRVMGGGAMRGVSGLSWCGLALVLACATWYCAGMASALSLSATFPLSDRDDWIAWALRQQTAAQGHLSLDKVVLASTHKSFNAAGDGYFNDTHLVESGQVMHNQVLSLAQQLAIGVRRIELDVHWVFDSLRVCRGNEQVYAMCVAASLYSRVPDVCARVFGINLLGEHTGCRTSDPELSETLAVVRHALDGFASDEVLIVKVLDATEGRASALDDVLIATFGAQIFTPADKVRHAGAIKRAVLCVRVCAHSPKASRLMETSIWRAYHRDRGLRGQAFLSCDSCRSRLCLKQPKGRVVLCCMPRFRRHPALSTQYVAVAVQGAVLFCVRCRVRDGAGVGVSLLAVQSMM